MSSSREFMDLVRAIGDCKSKQEEDSIVGREVVNLRVRLADASAQGRMRELMIRMMYCEMLGHRVEFGYIHAVNLTQRPTLTEKRTGYLAASLFLDSASELLILLVNTLQRDLKSTNHWVVCAALSSAGRLMGADTIPAVLKLVKDLVQHKEAHVRKQTLIALHGFLRTAPESVQDCVDVHKRALSDRDPSVMSAGLNGLFDLAKENPGAYTSVVPSLVVILKQIVEHRLPRDYDYHRMPAPWLQIKLLKLLAVLGHANQRASEEMYEVIREAMQATDLKTTIGFAIMFECIRTITRIYPQAQLLAAAAENTSRFVTSDNRNLRYIGIDALSAIVSINAEYAKQHQMAVIECLEDHDETLRRKTLALLFAMTNAQNAEFVVARMVEYLKSTRDDFLKRDLVAKITSLAEKFAPSNSWYIQTMNSVFESGGDLVSLDVAHNLLRLLAEGPSGDDEQDMELRRHACRSYLSLLSKTQTADRLIQVGSWTLGEYAYLLAPETDVVSVTAILCDLLQRSYYQDSMTKCYIVSALTKIASQNAGGSPDMLPTLATRYSSARDPALQQRCLELQALLAMPAIMRQVLPLDASCEDVQVDPELPMLDDYVSKARQSGAKPYMTESERVAAGMGLSRAVSGGAGGSANVGSHRVPEGAKLRFDAYAAPSPGGRAVQSGTSTVASSQAASASGPLVPAQADMPPSDTKLAAANALFAGLSTVGEGAAVAWAPVPDATSGTSTPLPQAAPPHTGGSLQDPATGVSSGASSQLGFSGLGGGVSKWSASGFSSPSSAYAWGGNGASSSASVASMPAGGNASAHATVTLRSTAPPTPTAAELKKKQMAASLFGGLTVTASSDGSAAARQASISMEPHGSGDGPGPRVQHTAAQGVDLLGLGVAVAADTSSAAVPKSAGDLDELFSSPKRPEPEQHASANGGGTGLFGDLSVQGSMGLAGGLAAELGSIYGAVPASSAEPSGGNGSRMPALAAPEHQVSALHADPLEILSVGGAGGSLLPVALDLEGGLSQGGIGGVGVHGGEQKGEKEDISAFGALLNPTASPPPFESFLRPAPISEQEFGNNWKLHVCEAKVEVTSPSLSTPDALKTLIEPRANARVVSIIGNEVIIATMHAAQGLCLMHARVSSGIAKFLVRTKDAAYSEAMVGLLRQRLA